MYVLDTNVVSELRKARDDNADRNVTAWAIVVLPSTLFLSVISILELQRDTLLIERRDPARGEMLQAWLSNHVPPAFDGRVLPIDTAVAHRCASLHVPDPRPERDALIAATALVHGMTIVTRNVADFAAMCSRIINPWKS
jgi:predicted nucleic acid-binding protein